MRCWLCALQGLVVFLSASAAVAADNESKPGGTTAMQLVRKALDADLAGRKDERSSLLQQALEQSPLYAPAHWHSGQMLSDSGWLPIQEAQRLAAADRNLRAYRQLRDQLDGSADAHAMLARFCRKQQWKDREEFHWTNVLRLRPGDREARSALHLQEYRGMLMTAEQIARYKELSQRAEDALKHWQPLLKKLDAAINGNDTPARAAATEQFAAIRDLAAIPAIALSLSDGSEAYCLAAIAALAKTEDQAATDALVWQAVASPHATVRQAATDALKPLSLYSYVPVLMGGLTSPLELTYYVNAVNPESLKFGYEVFRDGPVFQASQTVSRSSEVVRAGGFPVQAHPLYASARALQWGNAVSTRAAVGQQVDAANRATEEQNERYYFVLEQTTGSKLTRTPQAWWHWWEQHNELSSEDERPVYSRHYYRHTGLVIQDKGSPLPLGPEPPPPGKKRSCFVPGTLVWTETGLEPIENLRVGDRVLSQNPETGELVLRCIAETTLRSASPTRRIQLGSEMLLATLGHPFWAVGKGWRMAKELEGADRLHTLQGAASITALEAGPDCEAHNLVVEGFGTYFVGKSGLLVRDNTLRGSPAGPIPGYSIVAAKAE